MGRGESYVAKAMVAGVRGGIFGHLAVLGSNPEGMGSWQVLRTQAVFSTDLLPSVGSETGLPASGSWR